MSILFLTRKTPTDTGGLSRFCNELIAYFPLSQVVQITSFASWRRLRLGEVSIIHATDATLLPAGLVFKRLLGKPITLTVHGLDLTWTNPVYQRLLGMLLPHVSAIAVDSQGTGGLLNRFPVTGIPIRIIHPGISVRQFASKAPFQLPNVKRKIVLLTVGNLVARKGHGWFIEHVFTKLDSAFVYFIVGDGKEKRAIRRLVEKLNLGTRVFLLGKLSNNHLAFLLSKIADIYIAPNRRLAGDFEGFGIAMGEAAAMGLPAVASKVDGIPDIIHDQKNGWLIPPTADAFSAALMRLKDPKTRKLLGQGAQTYTRTHFSWQKSGKQYSRFFLTAHGR